MSSKKYIPQTDWQERLTSFSSGNRGRITAIATKGMTVIEEKHFRDIEYDPNGQGNDLIITLGTNQDLFTHTINQPNSIALIEEEDGEVSSMEIRDDGGDTTVIRLRTKI